MAAATSVTLSPQLLQTATSTASMKEAEDGRMEEVDVEMESCAKLYIEYDDEEEIHASDECNHGEITKRCSCYEYEVSGDCSCFEDIS